MANTPLIVKAWEVTMSFSSARRLDGWSVGVGRATLLAAQGQVMIPGIEPLYQQIAKSIEDAIPED